MLINSLHVKPIMSKDFQGFAMHSIFIRNTKDLHPGWMMQGSDLGDRGTESAKDAMLLNSQDALCVLSCFNDCVFIEGLQCKHVNDSGENAILQVYLQP